MKLRSISKIAFCALKVNRLRSALTILGIVIGIAAIIAVFSAGEGIKGLVLDQVDQWGSDFIEIEVKVPSTAKNSSENGAALTMGVTITTLKEDDAEAVRTHPNISYVYSAVTGQAITTYQSETKTANLWGVSSDYLNIDTGKVFQGRFFEDNEDKNLSQVAVLGPKLKEELFGSASAIGQLIKIGKLNFKVIGIMESKGSSAFFDMDKMAIVPIRSLQKKIMGIDYIMFLMAKMKNPALEAETVDDLTYMMRERHNISDPIKDDFAVSTMEEAKKMINSILGGVTLLLAAIAGISLIVGGVGIMNIMYVSVTERIFEIGLRKAVGATSADILKQFLMEAATLTFLGGFAGIIFGLLLSYGVAIAAQSQNYTWPFSINPIAIIVAVGVSVAVGLVFGLYPAKRAASLDPIESLRNE